MLKGKTVLITGASAGIGRACAEVFSAESCNLILLARRGDELEKLTTMLQKDHIFSFINIQCDVRNRGDVNRALESLPQKWKDRKSVV